MIRFFERRALSDEETARVLAGQCPTCKRRLLTLLQVDKDGREVLEGYSCPTCETRFVRAETR